MNVIECRSCNDLDCTGCNLYRLSVALQRGLFDDLKDEHHTLHIENAVALVRHGRWVHVYGYATPGGDPVWRCSECGKGEHIYGIEHGTYGADIADHQWVACPNCGARMEADT